MGTGTSVLIYPLSLAAAHENFHIDGVTSLAAAPHVGQQQRGTDLADSSAWLPDPGEREPLPAITGN